MISSTERNRQWVHILCVLFAFTLRYIPPSWAFLLAITAFIHNVLLLPKYAPHIFRKRESFFEGVAVYPLMVALAIVLFSDRLMLAGGVWAILALGDGFSTIIGAKWPLAKVPWNPRKSVGGMLAFVVSASIGAFLIMGWIGPVHSLSHLAMVVITASLVSAVFETLPFSWDDNIVVTLVAAAMLTLLWPIEVFPASTSFSAAWWGIALGINFVVAGLAWWIGLVSNTGALGGAMIGTAILAMGIPLYILLIAFFLLGSLATRIGYHEKVSMGIAQEKQGRRSAKHAIANCALALLAAILFGATDGIDTILVVFYCAALATALSDTTSSEIGQVYGRNPFLPTNFRLVPPGSVGAISVEGTLWGMGASLLFALIASSIGILPVILIPAVTIGGWIGFYSESYIAAIWTDEGIEVDNEWMNLLNTFLGGIMAVIIYFLTMP